MNSNNPKIQVGQLLKDSLIHSLPVYFTQLVFFLPSLIAALLDSLITSAGASVLITVIDMLAIVPFALGASTFHAHQYLTSQEATIPRSIQVAGERFTELVMLTFIFLALFLAGSLFFLIPGIYLLIRFSFIYYALIIENRSTFDAFNRSWQLTKGYWWKLFWPFLLFVFIIIILPHIILATIFGQNNDTAMNLVISFLNFMTSPLVSFWYVLLFMGFVNLVENNVENNTDK
ncbi:MAG: hypothetical protein AAFX80_10510 [Cyanobacteria bacterium J06639_18]